MTASCLLFPTGMGDQDKPYGMEYIITSEQFTELPEDEKKYWHYHLTELPRAQAALPDLTDEELVPLQLNLWMPYMDSHLAAATMAYGICIRTTYLEKIKMDS